MISLKIESFSCIRKASFTLNDVNVIIGPQGSGKSVTIKVFYFCTDIIRNAIVAAEKGISLIEFKELSEKKFSQWFPASAWGNHRFAINYNAGDFTMRILRRMKSGKPSSSVAINFSEWFDKFYIRAVSIFKNAKTEELSDSEAIEPIVERSMRIRTLLFNELRRSLDKNYIGNQIFIPAGRAFFTSIGRLVAGLELSSSLDPTTIEFARMFASIRESKGRRQFYPLSRDPDFVNKRNSFMQQLFGGEVRFEDELDYVQTKDGRLIPFSSLSSGQQELLPMWTLVDYYSDRDSMIRNRNAKNRSNHILYIEEPEAHLFPVAQSKLMDFLISSNRTEETGRRLFFTTHSPYIMARLNVYLKAGQLARRKKRNISINKVVPRECWLNSSQVSAWEIRDGNMRNIIDSEGLIDAEYLDGISDEISRDFSELLDIEHSI